MKRGQKQTKISKEKETRKEKCLSYVCVQMGSQKGDEGSIRESLKHGWGLSLVVYIVHQCPCRQGQKKVEDGSSYEV